MKIESVRIQNFRGFKDETVSFSDYTCFVGPNGVGKSTVLTALNVFFREESGGSTDLKELDEEDFHCKNTQIPIEITVTFHNLTEAAKSDFKDYVRQGRLIVSAVAEFDEVTRKAPVKQFGQRLAFREFAEFFEAINSGSKVSDLKSIYQSLRDKYKDLTAAGTKDAMISALREYEEARPEECDLLPSEDQFYGVSRGANRLARHIQWVYVPAVKDATSEQQESKNTALGKILARTVRAKTNFNQSVEQLRDEARAKYQSLLDESQHVLDGITASLQKRISEWAHPEARLQLRWTEEPGKSVRVEEPWARIYAGEGNFDGELGRFGHGLQRSYLLALLQELAEEESGADQGPTLILACEEPELYQHPPQARHLANVLQELSAQSAQVMITSHSAFFVSGEHFADVRMVNRPVGAKSSNVSQVSFDEAATDYQQATGSQLARPNEMLLKIHQALQPALNEMFFTRRLILVEGLEDVAYLTTYFSLLDRMSEYRRLGCHMVPVGGKSELIRPLIIAKRLGIPTYLLFDSDADKPDRSGSRIKHERDNRALLNLCGLGNADPMPEHDLLGIGFTMWASDIGATIANDIGVEAWSQYQAQADVQLGHVGQARKSTLHIGASLASAWADGIRSQAIVDLCERILDPAEAVGA